MKKLNIKENVLREMYIDNEMSCIDIARNLNCSQGTISKYLKEYGIHTRPFSRVGILPWNIGKTKEDDYRIKAPKTAFKKNHKSWLKGKHIQTNTGRTHFKKGRKSPRKGKKIEEIFSKKSVIK